ncbi:MAG: hypothetical protein LBR34_01320 [Prevotella sp.]|jgi:sialate O-acetylesterase|nr:hypothetical protein [Prevotella sp.]
MKTAFDKTKIIIAVCFWSMCSLLLAQSSALLLEENFDFLQGTNIVGQNGWTQGASGTNAVTVSEAGLSYPGYAGSGIGLAAGFTPLSDRIQKTFSGTLSGVYYYSFLINVSSAGSGEFFAGLFSANAFRGRAYIKADGGGFQFGLVKTTTGTVTYTSETPYTFGTTYLVVVKYEFITGSANDQVSLYVNPDLTTNNPGVPAIGPLADAGNDVSANVFAVQGRNNSGNFILDGIRIGTSWGAITGSETENHFLELPRCITSHAVLQRETPLKFWGWGVAGDTVKVELTRQDAVISDSAEIDAAGRWEISLPQQPVCKDPCRLVFSLKNYPETRQTLDDILIGDVWFAGGQSNMEKKVNHLLEADDYIREADDYPQIRAFRASYNPLPEPSEKVNAAAAPWMVCNSAQVADNVSAVAYVFAREIYEHTGIPVGIMQAYRGGTELETWVSPQKFTEPEYCKIAGRNDFITSGNALDSHSIHYNGQINPLIHYPLKGFIWYQGESNVKRQLEYRYVMKMLVEDWRALWGQGDLPFYYLQMFNVSAPAVYEESNWADLREQQSFLLDDATVSNTGMAIIIDTNEDPQNSDDAIRMHPRNKKPAGERLAKVALKNTYNLDILAESPELSRYIISTDSVYLYFKNIGSELKLKAGDSELKGFVVSGENRQFKQATATLLNDSVIVLRSELVATPVAVRYAWAKNPICNLYNSEDIPAAPFRTDMWKLSTYSLPQTSCRAQNGNARLVSVKINAVLLKDFNPDQFSYEINADNLGSYIDAAGVADNPFATVSATKSGSKILLTVTAEDGTARTYEITLKRSTSLPKRMENHVEIIRGNNAVIIQNTADEAYRLKILNSTGQCFASGYLDVNGEKTYTLSRGFYLIQLVNLSGLTKTVKYLSYVE